MKKKNKNNSAFSLIEILVVVIIVGIVVALAAPNFTKSYSRFQLHKTADDLLNISRWAQAMAMGRQRIYALAFSDENHAYRIECSTLNEESNTEADSGEETVFEPVNGLLGRKHVIPAGVSLDMQQEHIAFYPDGTMDPVNIQLNSAEQQIELSTSDVRGMMTKKVENQKSDE